MPEAVAALPNAAARRWPLELLQPLDRFLFGMVPSVNAEALAAWVATVLVPREPQSRLAVEQLGFGQVEQLLARVAPIHGIALTRLTRDWQSRLALLPPSEWFKLGFTLSVLPFCGHAQRSMDGNFRRALRDNLGPEGATVLDQYAGRGRELEFLLGAGAWKNPELVATSGVRAAFEQVCPWGEPIRRRFLLQFSPRVFEGPASVAGLDETWLEIACKISLQDHPWLWS